MQFLIRPPPDRVERKSGQISESVCILTQRMQGKEICVEMRFIMKSKMKKRCKQMLTGLLALSMLCGLLPQNTVNVSAATTAKTTVSSYGRLGTVDVGSKTKSGTWWKINVGNKTAFCLSLGKTCHTGNTYQVTDTHTWNQNTGGEKHGYYAKIIRFYVNDCNRAKKAFVLGQALIWAVSEGNTSEANLKNVIKQVKANTGYFPNKSVADLYKQIFQPSGTWEAKATMWKKTGATKGYQKLITVDAESSKLPGYKTTTDHTYYRQCITVHKQYENGRDLDEIVAEIADTYVENMGSALTRDFQLNVDDIRNFEVVKDNIFPKLVNLEKNSSRLEHVPYTQKEDLAVTYHIKMTGDSRTLGSLMITDAMLEGYGVNKEELHGLAMDNMGRLFPPTFQSLQEMMIELFADEFSRREGMPLEEAKECAKEMVPTGGPELYCLSNECKINGAACIIDDNIQKMIAEKVGGDYFVLPSSVHEVLIMPKSEDMDPKELRNMVQDVNATQVAEGEILSD